MSATRPYRLAGSIALAAAFASTLPACAQAQAQEQFGFLIVRSANDPYQYWVWAADCTNLNVASVKQKVGCELTRTECRAEKLGDCPSIQTNSTDLPPLPLTFGVTRTNPTCGWVWDPYRRTYVYKPC